MKAFRKISKRQVTSFLKDGWLGLGTLKEWLEVTIEIFFLIFQFFWYVDWERQHFFLLFMSKAIKVRSASGYSFRRRINFFFFDYYLFFDFFVVFISFDLYKGPAGGKPAVLCFPSGICSDKFVAVIVRVKDSFFLLRGLGFATNYMVPVYMSSMLILQTEINVLIFLAFYA